MPADLEFTGERYVPGTAGEIAHEHWHRYAFARRFVAGRRVLDVACGEGYGAALLAGSASHATGVDIDPHTLAHARNSYAKHANLVFVEGSAAALPVDDASVDVVTSFETIEHLPADDQPRMLAEFARVLRPAGILILSSPNRPEYSDARGYANPFHLHELDRDDLTRLLAPVFPAQRWYRQRRYLGSALWAEEASDVYEALTGTANSAAVATAPNALYFVVIAAREPEALRRTFPALSIFTDDDDAELDRMDHEAREVLRLDALLRQRDADLAEYVRHARELEAMVSVHDAERSRVDAAEREEIAVMRRTYALEHERLERQIVAQERIVAYRESVRWWLVLPWLRIRRLWNRVRGA